MPIKISIAPYIPPIKHPAKIVLTSQQRFDRLIKRLSRSRTKLRKFHFNLLQGLNGKVCLFDGDGIEVDQFTNSIEGIRIARQTALRLFLSNENQQGGFNFTSAINPEFMSFEEIEKARLQTRKLLDYQPFHLCSNCKFQFETEEFGSHRCIVGENWAVILN